MFEKGNSKKNQRSVETSYRFGDFELHPGERMLRQNGQAVPLPPKSLDALLYLVRNAEHLVNKGELIEELWPSTFVTEANLTNTIVSLRKVLGRDAIQTVSKHGYRFVLPVKGEPGIERQTYEAFTRAKELTAQRSLDSMTRARELYWLCIAQNPDFAPAWAWLGRCCWFLGKFSGSSASYVELADASFRRAFAIDPDLACAHQFYTPVEADMGEARRALLRLKQRIQRHPDEPESFTGLTQVLRFCGLLQESVEAHRRAVQLDPTVITSVPHTLFLAGEYAATIETYSGRTGYYLDAAAWAALGDKERARTLLLQSISKKVDAHGRWTSGTVFKQVDGNVVAFHDGVGSGRKIRDELEPEYLFVISDRLLQVRDWQFWGDTRQPRHSIFSSGFKRRNRRARRSLVNSNAG